jgi:opacity protein-like surface antigen
MRVIRGRCLSGRKLAGFLLLLQSPVLLAQLPPGVYGGVGVGLANFSVEDNDEYCCSYYYSVPDYNDGDESTALDLTLGYRINPYFAAEFVYFDATLEWQESFVYVPGLNDVFNNFVEADVRATQFTALGILPFARVWEAYLRAGIVYSQGDSEQLLLRTSDSAIFRRSLDETSTDLLLGVGIGASPAPAWNLRFEFQFFGVDRDLIGANGSTTINSMMFEFQYRPAGKRQVFEEE